MNSEWSQSGGSHLPLLTRRVANSRLALTVQPDPVGRKQKKTELARTASQVAQRGRLALPRQVVCLIPGTHPPRRELTVRSCLWLSSAYCVPLHKLKIIIATTTTKEHLVILKENKTSLFCYWAEDTMEMLEKRKQGKFYSSFLPLMR